MSLADYGFNKEEYIQNQQQSETQALQNASGLAKFGFDKTMYQQPQQTQQKVEHNIVPTSIGDDGVIQTSVVPVQNKPVITPISDINQVATQGLNPLQKANYNIQHALASTNKRQAELNKQVKMYQGNNPNLMPINEPPITDEELLNAYQLELVKRNKLQSFGNWIKNGAKHVGTSLLNSVKHPIHTAKKAIGGFALGTTDLPRQALSLSHGIGYAMSNKYDMKDYMSDTYTEPLYGYHSTHPNSTLGEALRHINFDDGFIQKINADNTPLVNLDTRKLYREYEQYLKTNNKQLYKNFKDNRKQEYLKRKHDYVNSATQHDTEYSNGIIKGVLGLSDSDLQTKTAGLGRLAGNIIGFGEGAGAASKAVQSLKVTPNIAGKAALTTEAKIAAAQQAIQNNKAIMNTVNAVKTPLNKVGSVGIPIVSKNVDGKVVSKLPFIDEPTIGGAAKVLNKNGVITAEFGAANYGLNELSDLGNEQGFASTVKDEYVHGLPFAGIHLTGKAIGTGGKWAKNKFDQTKLGQQWAKQRELSSLISMAHRNGLDYLDDSDIKWFNDYSKLSDKSKVKIVEALDNGVFTDKSAMERAIEELNSIENKNAPQQIEQDVSNKQEEPVEQEANIIKQEKKSNSNTEDELPNESNDSTINNTSKNTYKTKEDMLTNFEKNTGAKSTEIIADESVDIKKPYKSKISTKSSKPSGTSTGKSLGKYTNGKDINVKHVEENIYTNNKTIKTLESGSAEGADTLQRNVKDDGIDRSKNEELNKQNNTDFNELNKILDNKGEIYKFTEDGRLVYKMGEKEGLEVSNSEKAKLFKRLGGDSSGYRDFTNNKINVELSKQVRGDDGRTYLVDETGRHFEVFEDAKTGVWSVNSEFKNYKFFEGENGEIFAIKGNKWYKAKVNNDGMITKIATEPYDRYKGINKEEYAIDEDDILAIKGENNDTTITEDRHAKEIEYEDADTLDENKKIANENSKYENGMYEVDKEKEHSYVKYKDAETGNIIENVINGNKGVYETASEIIRKSNGDNRIVIDAINKLEAEARKESDTLGKEDNPSSKTPIGDAVDKIVRNINSRVDLKDKLPARYEITQEERDCANKFWNKISNVKYTSTKGTNPYIRLRNAFNKTRNWNKDEVQNTYNKLHERIGLISKEKGLTDRVREVMYADLEEAANKLEHETHITIERNTHQTRKQKENEIFNKADSLLSKNRVKDAVRLLHDNNIKFNYISSNENKKIYKKVYEQLYKETVQLSEIANDKDIEKMLSNYKNAVESEKFGGDGLSNFNNDYGQTMSDIMKRALELKNNNKDYMKYVKHQIHKTIRGRENAIRTINKNFEEPTHWIDNYEKSRVDGTTDDRRLLNNNREAYDHKADINGDIRTGKENVDYILKNGTNEDYDLIDSYIDNDGNIDIERLYNDIKRFEDTEPLGDNKWLIKNNLHKAEVLRKEYKNNLNSYEKFRYSEQNNVYSVNNNSNQKYENIKQHLQNIKKRLDLRNVKNSINGNGNEQFIGSKAKFHDVISSIDWLDNTIKERFLNNIDNVFDVEVTDSKGFYKGATSKDGNIYNDYANQDKHTIIHESNHKYYYSKAKSNDIYNTHTQECEKKAEKFASYKDTAEFEEYMKNATNPDKVKELLKNSKIKEIFDSHVEMLTDRVEIFSDTHGITHKVDINEFNDIYDSVIKNIKSEIQKGKYGTAKEIKDATIRRINNEAGKRQRSIGVMDKTVRSGATKNNRQLLRISNEKNNGTNKKSINTGGNNLVYQISSDKNNNSTVKKQQQKLEKDPIGFIDTLNDKQRKVLSEHLGGDDAAQVYSDIVKNIETYERDLRYLGIMSNERQLQDVINRYASNTTGKPIKDLTDAEKRGASKIVKAYILAEGAKSNMHYNVFNMANKENIDLNSNVQGKSDALFGKKTGWSSGDFKNPDKIVLSVLSHAKQSQAVSKLSDFVINNYGKEINPKQGVKRGYVAINKEVLNLSIFKKTSQHFYDAITGGKESIEKAFGKDGELSKELQDIYNASSEVNCQIPWHIYKQLFSGAGETGKQLKDRYGSKAFLDIQGKRLDEYMKPFNRIVLGLSPRWMVGNLVSNAVMSSKDFDNPLQFIKNNLDAFKVLDSDMPVGVIDNTLLGASRQASTRLFITGNETVDSCASAILGMAKIETKNLKTLNDKVIAHTANTLGLPARALVNLSGKLMEFNMKLENHQRKALYMRNVDKVGKDLISTTGQNIVRQSELLKYINENPKIKEQLGKSVLDTLGDYQRMTGFERNIVRRIAPYHKWVRAVSRYAANLFVKNPDFAAQLFWEGQKLSIINAQLQENQEYAVRVGKDLETNKNLVLNLTRYLNPLDTLKDVSSVRTALSMLHPALKSTIEAPFSNKVTFYNSEKTSANWKRIKNEKGDYEYINTKTKEKRDSLPVSEKLKAFGTEQLNNIYAPMNNRLLNIPEVVDSIVNYSSIDPKNKYSGKFRPKDKRYAIGYGSYNNNDIVPNIEDKNGKVVRRKAEPYSTQTYLYRKFFPIENEQLIKEDYLNEKEKQKFREKVQKQKERRKK